jgi:hypothetical protein
MSYEKNIAETTSKEKLERRHCCVTPLLLIDRITQGLCVIAYPAPLKYTASQRLIKVLKINYYKLPN